MKKRFFFAVALAAIVSGGAMLKAKASANETEGLSDLQKANIEALSSSKPDVYYEVTCYSTFKVNPGSSVIDCSTCSAKDGWYSPAPEEKCLRKAK